MLIKQEPWRCAVCGRLLSYASLSVEMLRGNHVPSRATAKRLGFHCDGRFAFCCRCGSLLDEGKDAESRRRGFCRRCWDKLEEERLKHEARKKTKTETKPEATNRARKAPAEGTGRLF